MTLLALGAATGVAIGSYALIHVRRKARQRDARAEEVWARLASNYGLTYTHCLELDDRIIERQVSGSLTGLSVRIEQATDSEANRRTTSVHVSVDWPYPRLALRPRATDAPRVPTGDQTFDDHGTVECEHPEFTAAVVSPQVRAAFVDLWQFAGEASFVDGKLRWRGAGVIAELKTLDGVLHRSLVAMRLLRAGTACLVADAEGVAAPAPGLYNPPK